MRLASSNAAISVTALSRPMPLIFRRSSTVSRRQRPQRAVVFFQQLPSDLDQIAAPSNPVGSRMAINSALLKAFAPFAVSRSRLSSLAGLTLKPHGFAHAKWFNRELGETHEKSRQLFLTNPFA